MNPDVRRESQWDRWIAELTDAALTFAAGIADAGVAARQLAARADRHDRLLSLEAVRWRLAGRLDADPADLVALTALGLVGLAALEPNSPTSTHGYVTAVERNGHSPVSVDD